MLALFSALFVIAAPDYLSPLSDAERAKATSIIGAMIANPRGPYAGISWYCNDGTEQPPHLNGCSEHGGGNMYGVFGPDAKRLFASGLFVGTVLTATKPEELSADNGYRARALVIERYLERALEGWVLKGAKTYRGFRQDEDEAYYARTHLMSLAGQKGFLTQDRAVLIRLMRALPYGRGGEALSDQIRALAGTIGDADKAFADLRFKIHALPEPSDIEKVEAYARQRGGDLGKQAIELAAAMRTYYDPASRVARLAAVKGWLPGRPIKTAIQTFIDTNTKDPDALLVNGVALMDLANGMITPTTDPQRSERNLLLLHAMGLVEELWLGITAELAHRPAARAQLLSEAGLLVRAAERLGLLSQREAESAKADLTLAAKGEAQAYIDGVARLARVLEWARARLNLELGVPLARYRAVEPRAAAVVDDILRSGVMLPLAVIVDRLSADAAALRGSGNRLVGVSAPAAQMRGENPGVAVGKLQILRSGDHYESLERDAIALLYELPPDLPPVAGVIVVGSVGSLSHVALLARNLAIPLASVSGEVAQALEAFASAEVFLGVSSARRVAVGPWAALAPEDKQTIRAEKEKPAPSSTFTINTAVLDLKTTRILRLEEISEADAGVCVGPKAAELGRLKRLFGDRVADAAVIPFGAFLRHVDTPRGDGKPTPFATLKAAYQRLREPLANPATQASAEQEMLRELEAFRKAILALPFVPGFEAEVLEALKRLGTLGQFGVFVRSDTNVEDLKDFTGAGLNLTLPNRVDPKHVLEAIREVWSSPFTERSYRWRQRLLTNPEQVFPSVVLHRTVPSEVSGVMVTTDLETGGAEALTISAGEGVSAVVDGGSPETVVIDQTGVMRLLSSPRSPVRKSIPKPPREGVLIEAAHGQDPLLDARAIADLRQLADEVRVRVKGSEAGLPWDIEFGFVGRKLSLMQIRPLKIARAPAAHPYLVALDAEKAGTGSKVLNLSEALP